LQESERVAYSTSFFQGACKGTYMSKDGQGRAR
jgi:hypothetical protein